MQTKGGSGSSAGGEDVSGMQLQGALVGVGITFGQFHKDHPHAGALYVKHLQEHGPAMQSGMVHKGDILYEIDGTDSYRRPIDRIQSKILGPVRVIGHGSRTQRGGGGGG
jgi:C-terminal processing protease CtpA/Prc